MPAVATHSATCLLGYLADVPLIGVGSLPMSIAADTNPGGPAEAATADVNLANDVNLLMIGGDW